jgi:photosystem II stability/assembly factor-like uncharacterized protein
MKKIILFSALLLLALYVNAQDFIGTRNNQVKFADIVNEYESKHEPEPKEKAAKAQVFTKGNLPREADEKDYLFERWKWYWQQHLDPNGYMVSPAKTWEEWEKYTQAGKAAKTTIGSMANWTFQGPDSSGADGSGVGRINVIAFHPTNANTYWVGCPGGGAWKTTNNGLTWTSMTDNLPLLSVSDIKFNPRNPNTVYICTGDKDGNDYFSAGVIKSYDGGAHWINTGIIWPVSSLDLANSLLVNPTDTNTLILGTRYGIYLSHNGGTSWALATGSTGRNFKQLLYRPNDTNIVYGTTRYNDSTSVSGQIFRSTDGGTSWTQITAFSDALRITLAVTPANTSIVEAVVASSDVSNRGGLEGIYKSTNSGATFPLVYAGGCGGSENLLNYNASGFGCGGQGHYDLSIAISPTNPNIVCVGGVNGWQSGDGGVSWALMDQWSFAAFGVVTIHADKHFMAFHPLLPNRFFECNDGGVYWSDFPSATSTWNDITNGLGITEIYRIAVSNMATYELIGAQDVGTKQVQSGFYQDVFGGDGMQCQLDPLDTNTAYVASQYGNIYGILAGVGVNISGNIPGIPTGGWITPYLIEPSCNICLLAGYQEVWETTDQGYTWSSISPTLTGTNLLRIATSLSSTTTVYAVENASENVFYTSAMGTAGWTTITAPYTGGLISDIKVDQFDATKIWVTFSGYSSPQVASYSPATGWALFNTGLPNVPVSCIMIDTSNRIKYIGTDVGVFYRDTTMSAWMLFNANMPVVRVNDLQINYATNEIWAGTYGRSLWKSPRQTFYGPTNILPLATDYLTVAPNPGNGNFRITLGSNISEKEVKILLINNNGKTVLTENAMVTNGNTLNVSVSGFAAGNYVLCVENGGNVIGRKKVTIY